VRALLLTGPRVFDQSPLALTEVPAPQPGPGQVRLQIRCCAICHTDLHIVEGDLPLPKLPIIPGHQIVGVIDAVGGAVHQLKVGDRVGVPWLHSTDGTCQFCLAGNENLCEQARFTGYHVDGGYAEYCVADAKSAYLLPAAFSAEHAAPLLCAGVIGFRAYRLSRVKPGQRLGLYGFGASAHLVLQLARFQGCEVYVFTRGAGHRKVAEDLGAAWTGSGEDSPPHPLDASIIFAPAGSLVPLALRVLRKGGVLALAGITMSPIPALNYELLYHERVVCSVANSTRGDCREFLRQAAEIPIRPRIQLYPLADANRALQDLKHSRLEAAAVLETSN